MYNKFYFIILGISSFFFFLDKYIDHLNTKNWSDELPQELKGIYDEEKYKKSQQYQKEVHRFSNITGSFMFAISFMMLVFFGYGVLDSFLRSFISDTIYLALLFFGMIYTVTFIISKPFSWYANFHIEERFGFNKMTQKTFFTDSIKELLMTYIVGGFILGLITWIYEKIGPDFWIYSWILLTAFSLFMLAFYSSLIVPLFNKQTPMAEGDLKKAIQDFATKTGFEIENIFLIDGSKRSTKANAYFTGIGSKKRIVLFDTLVDNYSQEEIIAVLAHEIGHYKKKHTLQSLAYSIFQTGLMLFLFSLMTENSDIALALGSDTQSFHIGLLAFGILFTPLSEILGIIGNMLSRKNEYEADRFAAENHSGESLGSALKKLSVDNLSNLRPHDIYEFVHYSHPTLLKRLSNLEKVMNEGKISA